MPEHSLGSPIWTPEHAAETARVAAEHTAYVGSRNVDRSCGGCGAGPREECQRGCPKTAGPVGMRPNRAAAISRWLIAVATILLFLSVAAVWIAAVPR